MDHGRCYNIVRIGASPAMILVIVLVTFRVLHRRAPPYLGPFVPVYMYVVVVVVLCELCERCSDTRLRSTGWPNKNGTIILYALSSSNINRFSKFFHCQNQEKIYNNTITKDPTTPQVCRYTTL